MKYKDASGERKTNSPANVNISEKLLKCAASVRRALIYVNEWCAGAGLRSGLQPGERDANHIKLYLKKGSTT